MKNALFFLPFSILPLIVFSGWISGSKTAGPETSVSLAPKPKENGVGILQLKKARKDGDYAITIQFLDSDGKRHSVSVSTGKAGTKHKDDDIKKGTSAEDKAKKLTEAINKNPELQGKVHAVRVGHVVNIEKDGDGKGVVRVTIQDGTDELGDHAEVSYPEKASQSVVPPDPEVARVIMIGFVQGLDDDDQPANVTVGTNKWVGTWATQNYQVLADLVQAIKDDLVQHGIQASLENPFSIRIELDDLDGGVIFGNTDCGIHMQASSGSEPL